MMMSISAADRKKQQNEINAANNTSSNNAITSVQYRGTYEYDTNKLLNLGSLSVP